MMAPATSTKVRIALPRFVRRMMPLVPWMRGPSCRARARWCNGAAARVGTTAGAARQQGRPRSTPIASTPRLVRLSAPGALVDRLQPLDLALDREPGARALGVAVFELHLDPRGGDGGRIDPKPVDQ